MQMATNKTTAIDSTRWNDDSGTAEGDRSTTNASSLPLHSHVAFVAFVEFVTTVVVDALVSDSELLGLDTALIDDASARERSRTNDAFNRTNCCSNVAFATVKLSRSFLYASRSTLRRFFSDSNPLLRRVMFTCWLCKCSVKVLNAFRSSIKASRCAINVFWSTTSCCSLW